MFRTDIPLGNLRPPTQDSDQASVELLLPTLPPTAAVSRHSPTGAAATNSEYEAHKRFFERSASPPAAGNGFTSTGV